MAKIPPELFRRKKTFQMLQFVEASVEEFRAVGARDNYNAVMAGYNDLAAHFATLAGRQDIAKDFGNARDSLIAAAKDAPRLRSENGVKQPRRDRRNRAWVIKRHPQPAGEEGERPPPISRTKQTFALALKARKKK